MSFLLGTKLGMTRVFDQQGRIIPVTAIQAGPCVVVQNKTIAKDGYNAIQLGLGLKKHPNQPLTGHSKALTHPPQHIREFRTDRVDAFSLGQVIDCTSLSQGATLKLTGISKGKGFAGVIKRHHFHRGPETHGSDHHRAPGSIGSMFPQHVTKGKKMPGKMGRDQVTVRKVRVVDIIADQNIVLVKGPVPGSRGSLIEMAEM
jgi:large subunit ribosomal protein L3